MRQLLVTRLVKEGNGPRPCFLHCELAIPWNRAETTAYIREIVRSASHCSPWRFTSLFGMSLLITLMLQVGSMYPLPESVASISVRS